MPNADELAYATHITLVSANCNAAEVLRPHLSKLGMSEECIQQNGSLQLKNGLEFFIPSSMYPVMGKRDPYNIGEISGLFPGKEFSLTVHFKSKRPVHYHVQNGRMTDLSFLLHKGLLPRACRTGQETGQSRGIRI